MKYIPCNSALLAQKKLFLTIWGHFGPNLAYKKILGKFTKVLGFGKTPPMLGKIPK